MEMKLLLRVTTLLHRREIGQDYSFPICEFCKLAVGNRVRRL